MYNPGPRVGGLLSSPGRRVGQTLNNGESMSTDEVEVRVPLLKRLAEQAMSDGEFRAVAREDLDAALTRYGYDLNARERDLVFRFRAALADAGVDLALIKELDMDELLNQPDAVLSTPGTNVKRRR
jgi:hypothetical protein